MSVTGMKAFISRYKLDQKQLKLMQRTIWHAFINSYWLDVLSSQTRCLRYQEFM